METGLGTGHRHEIDADAVDRGNRVWPSGLVGVESFDVVARMRRRLVKDQIEVRRRRRGKPDPELVAAQMHTQSRCVRDARRRLIAPSTVPLGECVPAADAAVPSPPASKRLLGRPTPPLPEPQRAGTPATPPTAVNAPVRLPAAPLARAVLEDRADGREVVPRGGPSRAWVRGRRQRRPGFLGLWR